MTEEQRQAALDALDRLENDALCYRDGYGETRKDAETIRAALKQQRVPVIEIPHEAIDNLYNSDMHWAMVSVSRQALDEILKFFYTYTETQEKIACDDAFKEVFKLLAEKVSLIQKKVKESNAD